MVSLYVIGLACLLAVFAYPLAPDNSPDASRMLAELRDKRPGFSKQFLKVPRQAAHHKSFFAALFTGTEPAYNLIPVNDFFFARDTLIVQHYIAKGIQDTMAFALKNLLPPPSNYLPLGRQQRHVLDRIITCRTFLLGTDRYGRDVLSRLIIGTRISIGVGLLAGLMALGIGLLLGSLAGYYRGLVDAVVMYFINVLTAIPWPLLAFAITLCIGLGFGQICVAVGLVMWAGTARLVRAEVMSLREREYVQAARILGLFGMRIISRHILPNIVGPLMVIASSNLAAAIIIEAGLSFLGIGVQPPMPSWGLMIREQWDFLPAERVALALIPGLATVILAGAFNILGNALRDVLDLRDNGQR